MPRAEFTVLPERRGGVVVLRIAGELDLNTAPVLKRAALAHAAPGVHALALDLGAVGFLDSAGIQALLTVWQAVSAQDCLLFLVDASRTVRNLLQRLRLDAVFHFASEADLPRA